MLDEPLNPVEAKRLLREILQSGSVTFRGMPRRRWERTGLPWWMSKTYYGEELSILASSRRVLAVIGSVRLALQSLWRSARKPSYVWLQHGGSNREMF